MKRSRGGAAGRRWRNRFVTLLYPAFVTLLYPVVLYQDEAITVTTSFLKSGGRQYPLAELSLFHRVEHSGWLRPRLYELRARFRGRTVRLFRSYDSEKFGRVCRALVRARERAGLA